MNYLIHATPIHPSLCLQYLILLFTIVATAVFILLLLLLFCYYHYYKTIATDKLLQASLFLGAAKLTTHLLRLINILWLPLCRINKFGFYFPRRLSRSPILVGHHSPLSLSPAERCPSSTLIPSVTRKHCRIFTDIFRVVRVLDHMFDAAMPSSYVWIPSEVLHAQH
jgi:hypothetical protein